MSSDNIDENISIYTKFKKEFIDLISQNEYSDSEQDTDTTYTDSEYSDTDSDSEQDSEQDTDAESETDSEEDTDSDSEEDSDTDSDSDSEEEIDENGIIDKISLKIRNMDHNTLMTVLFTSIKCDTDEDAEIFNIVLNNMLHNDIELSKNNIGDIEKLISRVRTKKYKKYYSKTL